MITPFIIPCSSADGNPGFGASSLNVSGGGKCRLKAGALAWWTRRMGKRSKTDGLLAGKRVENDLKVLRYLLENLDQVATGRLESPEKLAVFYAGYTAMRSLWEVKTKKGKLPRGDRKLDEELRNVPGCFIFRVNVEVSHSIGEHSKTLLRVTTFKFWAKTMIGLWGT